MEIESIHKYISLNKMANGSVEVIFAGQPCLTVTEGVLGLMWRINPVFAKLVYGANVFEDIPVCSSGFDTTEDAISSGLVRLHELGAFNTEVDFPEDTYAATLNAVSEEVKQYALKNTSNIFESYNKYDSIMKSIKKNTFDSPETYVGVVERRSEYDANLLMASNNKTTDNTKKKHVLKTPSGSVISSHDTESGAISAFKKLTSTSGVKIMREEYYEETDVTEILVAEDATRIKSENIKES